MTIQKGYTRSFSAISANLDFMDCTEYRVTTFLMPKGLQWRHYEIAGTSSRGPCCVVGVCPGAMLRKFAACAPQLFRGTAVPALQSAPFSVASQPNIVDREKHIARTGR